MMPAIGFVNGVFMPLDEARVSVEDRGYQFGDGIYEVIRTYGGVPFQLDLHLARLERSAEAIGLRMSYLRHQWETYIVDGLRRAGFPESKVYLQVTRGTAPRDHAVPAAVAPTVVMTIRELRPLDTRHRTTGVAAVTMEDLRWGRCDIKSINLLPNVMARQRAADAGAFEAILVRDGVVTEGAASNVMVVRDGTVRTAPEGPSILSGVTRALVLDLARKDGLTVQERAVALAELAASDEVFLAGTTVEVLPVVLLDGRPIGTGRPGPVTSRLADRFTQIAVGR
jgi:D-alanine transaminase